MAGESKLLWSILIGVFFLLGTLLLVRGFQGRFLSKFPLFYSYVAYALASGLITTPLYFWNWKYYPQAAWLRFLVSVIAEFAVLVEISDHIFGSYPAIRKLGRLLAVSLSLALFFGYIFPAFLTHLPMDQALLEFSRKTCFIKAAIIVVLLAAARFYKIPLGRNISGIITGLVLYLGINIANLKAAGHFGQTIYATVMQVLVAVSSSLCLLVWTVAMWWYEPAPAAVRRLSPSRERLAEPLGDQLGRFNATLTKFLER